MNSSSLLLHLPHLPSPWPPFAQCQFTSISPSLFHPVSIIRVTITRSNENQSLTAADPSVKMAKKRREKVLQSGRQVRTLEVLQGPLPRLITGPHHTKSSALHRLRYEKSLSEWSTFPEDVERFCSGLPPVSRPIYYIGRSKQDKEAIEEFVAVGQENGVQGRFMQCVGTVLGGILRAFGIDIKFSCWKAGRPKTPRISGEPDIALLDRTWTVMSIGEVKAFWIPDHGLHEVEESHLRLLLAQPLRYMRDAQCEYGFLTTYNQTIFLRQVQTNNVWGAEYSRVVFRDDEYAKAVQNQPDPRDNIRVVVSAKQCFLYLCSVASQATPTQNLTPRGDWVCDI